VDAPCRYKTTDRRPTTDLEAFRPTFVARGWCSLVRYLADHLSGGLTRHARPDRRSRSCRRCWLLERWNLSLPLWRRCSADRLALGLHRQRPELLNDQALLQRHVTGHAASFPMPEPVLRAGLPPAFLARSNREGRWSPPRP